VKTVGSIGEIRSLLGAERLAGRSIGLVPTMGALHEGHLSLVRAARTEMDFVVVSIFVNPLQFGPGEDLEAYPRDEQRDLEKIRGEGVDAVFMPGVEDMYPPGTETTISVGRLGEILEGAHRPGHFDGVCTVVAKLFNIVGPERAYFGQKDAQQAAVLKQMARDLDFDVDLEIGPIVREPDGLAMSSRNAYLGGEDRARATTLYAALQAGRELAAGGERLEVVEKRMWSVLAATDGVEPHYASAVDPDTFGSPRGGRVLLAVAARVGPARLIDNLLIDIEES
jgi:pantoate--beta-alanine ligase